MWGQLEKGVHFVASANRVRGGEIGGVRKRRPGLRGASFFAGPGAGGRAAAALALALVASGGCGKKKADDATTALPATVELAVNEQAVFTSGELEDYRIDGGGVVSVAATPKWLLLGGLRPGRTQLTVKRRNGPPLSATVVVSDGPLRRGVEVSLAPGETRVLDVPEVLSYEIRGRSVFEATLENPRAIGVRGAEPGVGTLAVLGKGEAFALYRIVVTPRSR